MKQQEQSNHLIRVTTRAKCGGHRAFVRLVRTPPYTHESVIQAAIEWTREVNGWGPQKEVFGHITSITIKGKAK